MKRIITYVLCFHMPDGSREHYVGLSTPNRLKLRLKEHAIPTSRTPAGDIMRRGGIMHLAATSSGGNRRIERFVQEADTVAALCPRCQGTNRRDEIVERLNLPPRTMKRRTVPPPDVAPDQEVIP